MTVDIVLRNARLRGEGEALVDISINGGRIISLDAKPLNVEGRLVVDAAGGLVTPAFVNPHLHLCKVWTESLVPAAARQAYHNDGMSRSLAAIDLASGMKTRSRADEIAGRARRAVALAALHGNLHIRAFADVDSKAKLEGLDALLAVREEFKGLVDIEVVAFPQDGIARDPGTAELMDAAMRAGADIVGGIPWIEASDAETSAHIGLCFELAEKFGKDISMLLDDVGNGELKTLEMMAREVVRRGMQGRALAHHCRAMALYDDSYFRQLVELLEQADVAIVSDPHTGPLHARVKELLELKRTVCLGQDDISDAYYPFGRNNMLEVAFLASHLLWMTSPSDIEALYEMVTTQGAKALKLSGYGVKPGDLGNLVVLNQSTVGDALRWHEQPKAVVSHGKLLDLGKMRSLAGY
jgi:cytosine/creatinine deaminase